MIQLTKNTLYGSRNQTVETRALESWLRDNTQIPFSVLHLNIRSVNKNFEQLEILLDGLYHNFSVIVLSETWIVGDTNLYNLPNYTTYYNYSKKNQNDGVIIYVHSSLPHYTETIKELNTNFLRVLVELKTQKIAVTGLYRSPNEKQEYFISDLDQYINKHCLLKNEILIGDTNLNILQHNVNEIEEYKNILAENGYIQLISAPTRIFKTTVSLSQSCIDHIYMKTDLNFSHLNPLILNEQITDHYPIIMILQNHQAANQHTERNQQHKRYVINKKLTQNLSKINWENTINFSSTDDMNLKFEKFVHILKSEINSATIEIKHKSSNKKRKPWITNAIIASANTKNRLYFESLKEPEIRHIYLEYKKELCKIIKERKKEYYSNKFRFIQTCDIKTFWKTTNEILGKKRQ